MIFMSEWETQRANTHKSQASYIAGPSYGKPQNPAQKASLPLQTPQRRKASEHRDDS